MLCTEIVSDIQSNICTQHVLQKEELLTKIYLQRVNMRLSFCEIPHIKFKIQLPGARICAPRPTVEGGPGLDGGRGPPGAPLPPGGADRVSGPDGGPALPGAGGPVPGGGGPWLLPVGTIARPLPPEI